jgi:hypothetical protein
MTNPAETLPSISPVDILANSIQTRQEELAYLLAGLESGIELSSDLEQVNAILAASPRPDLIMTERVEISPLDTLNRIDRAVNNFVPSWSAFGAPVYGEERGWLSKEPTLQMVGRRPLNSEERQLYFFMGARGDYDEHMAFAKEHGIDPDLASDMIMQTHLNREAFMRMWILMPEFTERLMEMCLKEIKNQPKKIDEEIFVAFTLMTRLVDMNDRGIVKKDGTIDEWLFCH